MNQSENVKSEEWRTIKGYEGRYEVSNLGRVMNSLNMFNKEFPNDWRIDVKHNPYGFGDMYSTDYPYSVMVHKRDTGFTKFVNIEKPSEVFQYITEVQKW